MYGSVPATDPAAVDARERVAASPSAVTARVAIPKSSTLVPELFSITLPGFRSRCTMPFSCAASSAPAISVA